MDLKTGSRSRVPAANDAGPRNRNSLFKRLQKDRRCQRRTNVSKNNTGTPTAKTTAIEPNYLEPERTSPRIFVTLRRQGDSGQSPPVGLPGLFVRRNQEKWHRLLRSSSRRLLEKSLPYPASSQRSCLCLLKGCTRCTRFVKELSTAPQVAERHKPYRAVLYLKTGCGKLVPPHYRDLRPPFNFVTRYNIQRYDL